MRLTSFYVALRLFGSLLFVLTAVDGQIYENVTSLKTSLLTNYDTVIVPRNNISNAVDVTISVNLFTVFDVDIVSGMLTLLAIVDSTWTDERITWNSADYGGLSMLKFAQNTVWKPNIAMAKSLEMDDLGEAWMTVKFDPNGVASWDAATTFQTACAFDVEFWPFDKQVCYLDFITYGTGSDEVLITTPDQEASMFNFIPHSEWDVDGTFAVNRTFPTQTSVRYGIRLKRHSTFYSLTIIIPLIILNMFTCCVFVLPSDSGERIGFSVTILLSIVVFFLLIGDHVPKTADPLPHICNFVGLIIGTACSSLLFTIVSLTLYFREGEVPDKSWGRRLVQMVRFVTCRRTNGAESKRLVVNKVDVLEKDIKRSPSVIEAESAVETLEWKDVSRALDKILFVLFLVATLIPSFVFPLFLSIASTYPDQ